MWIYTQNLILIHPNRELLLMTEKFFGKFCDWKKKERKTKSKMDRPSLLVG